MGYWKDTVRQVKQGMKKEVVPQIKKDVGAAKTEVKSSWGKVKSFAGSALKDIRAEAAASNARSDKVRANAATARMKAQLHFAGKREWAKERNKFNMFEAPEHRPSSMVQTKMPGMKKKSVNSLDRMFFP